MILIFDATQGYPARCLGRHPIDGDDPVRVTGIPDAVAMPAAGFEGVQTRYLSLDDAPPGGSILVNTDDQADDVAREGLRGRGLLGLAVIAGALTHVVRNRVTGLTAAEQAALDLIAAALPDVPTLRDLLQRGGLGRDLAQVRTILEDLAGS